MLNRTLGDLALETSRFRQSKARCGPASLKIVAGYFQINVSEERAAAMCRTSRVSGTTGRNLASAARKLGLAARIVDGANLRMVAAWLRKGVPVIVDWMSVGHRGAVRAATGHYSVVSGLTATDIILDDPAIGRKRRLPRKVFTTLWYDFKYLSPRKPEDLIIRRMIVIAPSHMVRGSGHPIQHAPRSGPRT